MSGRAGARESGVHSRDGAPATRRGRRPGTGDTRGRVLAAARETFAERGFDGATVRDVAARAGVDPALVHHYFGSKQRLFVAAMEFPVDLSVIFPAIAAGPRELLGERIVAAFVTLWDQPEVLPTLLGIARSATTDPVAAEMFRGVLVQGPLQALGALLDTPDAQTRVALVGSQLIGLAMGRYVARLEPLASLPPEALAVLVGPTLTRYLLGDLGPPVASTGFGEALPAAPARTPRRPAVR